MQRTDVCDARAEDNRCNACQADDDPERQHDDAVCGCDAQERHGDAALDERRADGVEVLGDVEQLECLVARLHVIGLPTIECLP
jgi:hypothetical protein